MRLYRALGTQTQDLLSVQLQFLFISAIRLIAAVAVTLPTRSIWFPASIYHLLLEVKRLVAIDQLVCGPVLHASLLCGVDSAINRPVALSSTCRGWLARTRDAMLDKIGR